MGSESIRRKNKKLMNYFEPSVLTNALYNKIAYNVCREPAAGGLSLFFRPLFFRPNLQIDLATGSARGRRANKQLLVVTIARQEILECWRQEIIVLELGRSGW